MLQSGIDGGRASSILLMKFVVYQAMIVLNFLVALLIGFHYMVAKMSYLSLFVVFGFVIHFGVIVGLLLVMFWPKFTKRAVRIIATPLKFFLFPVNGWLKILKNLMLKLTCSMKKVCILSGNGDWCWGLLR